MNIQTGANADPAQNSLNIGSALTSSDTSSLNMPTGSALKTALSSSHGAASLLDNIDSAISSVSSQRASVGSYQNALTGNIANLAVAQTNPAVFNRQLVILCSFCNCKSGTMPDKTKCFRFTSCSGKSTSCYCAYIALKIQNSIQFRNCPPTRMSLLK